MQLVSAIAIYFVVWWLVLFMVLPWGATSAHEAGEEVDPGTMKSAPLNPRILKKFAITTVLAGVVFAVIYFVASNNLISLDDIPFFPKFRSITD